MTETKTLTWAIDLDGTLTKSIWFPGLPEPEPYLDRIAKINDMYNNCQVIFIHTARKEENRPETEMWPARRDPTE